MSDFLFVLIIFLIVILGVGISIFYIKKETKKLVGSQKEEFPLGLLKQDIDNLRRKFENGYSRMAHELGQVQEIGRNIREFQNFLRSPKSRGNIGEQVLRDLLGECLPKQNFSLQYQFQEGQIVDAVLKTNQGLIPIDSKFPMENFRKILKEDSEEKEVFQREFQRDIKKHIDDISKKYILPQEGTVDFALMYVPSEPIYYEITLNQPEILDYGYQKKIYFVSPNSFYYFLKIVMIGLEGVKIEEGAKKILEGMKAVQQEAMKFEEELSILFSHVDHAKASSERTRTKFNRLVGKIERVGELEAPEERKKIE
ncbi:MAG: DNA recombination protein RmuC [Patescibacteria group bacterium]|nr:DNA recombination protein RmuC [Patescibacteria group bacterium]